MEGEDSAPPHRSFCFKLSFYETTLKQYIIVCPIKKETVRSYKLGILYPFEILVRDFGKNPVATEKFITQSNILLVLNDSSI